MMDRNGGSHSIKIVIPDDIVSRYTLSSEIKRLRAAGVVEIHNTAISTEADLISRVCDANVILSFRPAFTRFTSNVIRECHRLQFICIAGAGVEDVDVAYATKCGIAVGNVVQKGKRAIVEHCIALMFDVARQIAAQDREIRSGTWKAYQGIELGGKTLGIIGLSAIARELAPIAKAIGMNVISWSRNNDPMRAATVGSTAVSIDEVLSQSDILSLHLRLIPELKGFLDEKKFALIKRGAILINTARGELIDENALVAALSNGNLRGAGLDVFTHVPLPQDSPLLSLPNVVMTPTSAWNTVESSQRMIRRSIDNVLGFISGQPIDIVNAIAINKNK